jgi:hypothetical protein
VILGEKPRKTRGYADGEKSGSNHKETGFDCFAAAFAELVNKIVNKF